MVPGKNSTLSVITTGIQEMAEMCQNHSVFGGDQTRSWSHDSAVILSLWQPGPRNLHLDGFNATTGLAISGILTFGRGDKQGLAVFSS
jgi:hypothetical protein